MSTVSKHKGNPATDDGAAFQRSREGMPPFGNILEVAWQASGASQTVPHRLGRTFVGAVIIGQTSYTTTYATSTPGDGALNDVDPGLYLAIAPSASHTGTLRLWVF